MIEPSLLDNLKPGAGVWSTDGEVVGRLHAMVLDPRDGRVTHIVVSTGPYFPEPGFGAPDLVTVPVEEMADAREQKVILKCTKRKFAAMPAYVERRYAPSREEKVGFRQWRAGQMLWEVGGAVAASLAGATRIGVPRESFERAEFEAHILNDAPVWRLSPHSHIGEVERVLVDEEAHAIVALVIRRGALFHRDVTLPIRYVTEIEDGVIHADISDEEVKGLEPYEAPPEPRARRP
jgi:sporulation protein YlmC with PRC-barrel domain